MATIDEIRKNRIKKAKAIKAAGLSVYPTETKRTHTTEEALQDFNKLSKSEKEIVLAGRIMSLRQHGGLIFSNLRDGKDKLQLMFRKNKIGEKGYKFFLDNFDIGDFIEAKGTLFKTKKGEKTLLVSDYKMLAKSLLPLPEKWHGIKDIEERYRKRYLDLLFNKEVKEKFILRSKIIKEIREFLEKKGFLEVETPILQPIYGGAKAKPFKTHLNALDIDLYLRIAPELYLKRLLIGGFEKVYEIGKCFRNEGVDRAHNPDFTMLEFYWAYADYKDMMKLTEELFSKLLKNLFGSLKIKYEGKEINFKLPWPRIEFSQLLRKYTKINLDEIHIQALKKEAKRLGMEPEGGASSHQSVIGSGGKAEIADEIYKKFCRPKIRRPTFVIHHPEGSFPLAKGLEKNQKKTANFQLVVGGFELINAIFKAGFKEAQRMDKDFIEALEYGMPPAAGFGMGIDRLTALLTDSHSLREVILFPTMKPK